jgi:aspartyl-tRNA synthetase
MHARCFKQLHVHISTSQWSVCSFGTDKPDLRIKLELADVSECFAGSTFKIFADTVAQGGIVKVLRIPEVCHNNRKPWLRGICP